MRQKARTFFHMRSPPGSVVGEPRGAISAAGDARAARPSRPMLAAAAPRRRSRRERRLAAPSHLAAACSTSGSSERSERSTNSARIEPQSAEKTPATPAPTTVMAAVGLAALCRRTSNGRQREGCAAAGSGAAGGDTLQGKVDAAQRAARRGEVERAPEAVAAAVPPLTVDVLRSPTRPQPASCATVERDDRERAASAGRPRVECSRSAPSSRASTS